MTNFSNRSSPTIWLLECEPGKHTKLVEKTPSVLLRLHRPPPSATAPRGPAAAKAQEEEEEEEGRAPAALEVPRLG